MIRRQKSDGQASDGQPNSGKRGGSKRRRQNEFGSEK